MSLGRKAIQRNRALAVERLVVAFNPSNASDCRAALARPLPGRAVLVWRPDGVELRLPADEADALPGDPAWFRAVEVHLDDPEMSPRAWTIRGRALHHDRSSDLLAESRAVMQAAAQRLASGQPDTHRDRGRMS